MIKYKIPCSPEQVEVIADHLLDGKELGLQPDERNWMISMARKKYPGCRIKSADLNIIDAEWTLELDVPNVTNTN